MVASGVLPRVLMYPFARASAVISTANIGRLAACKICSAASKNVTQRRLNDAPTPRRFAWYVKT